MQKLETAFVGEGEEARGERHFQSLERSHDIFPQGSALALFQDLEKFKGISMQFLAFRKPYAATWNGTRVRLKYSVTFNAKQAKKKVGLVVDFIRWKKSLGVVVLYQEVLNMVSVSMREGGLDRYSSSFHGLFCESFSKRKWKLFLIHSPRVGFECFYFFFLLDSSS